ncbi:general substrate transporter [Xylariomycetidae sp. FL0641]|nr:general substrate transporter [Xylariomycetidae sp. FL0641]
MASAATEPLMRRESDEYDHDEYEHEHDEDDPASTAPRPDGRRTSQTEAPGPFVWKLTVSAGISGLLFGYDTGVISATLVSLGTSLTSTPLTALDKSIVTSITSLLALFASPLASVLADAYGRRPVLLLADLLFILGALAQAFASQLWHMVLGRAIVGAAVGAASFATPLYIAELAPAAHRGRLVTANSLAITGGQVVAYVIGWLTTTAVDAEIGWRYLVGLGALPALAQAVAVLSMPESPRWLVQTRRAAEARRVVARTLGENKSAVDAVLRDIETEVREEEEQGGAKGADGAQRLLRGWRELLTVPKNKRALTIACMLQGLQQLCGFNSLMYFSATIFSILGFSVPTLTSLSVATTNFAFTVVAMLLIDRIGRRRILLYSIPFMVVGLLLSAAGFEFTELSMGEDEGAAHVTQPETDSSHSAAVVILVSIMVYVASYAIGLGNVAWQQSELFPLSVRSLGSGLATATNWGANFIIGLTFLPMMEFLTPTWTFVLYAGVCVAGWLAVWAIYPETVGLSLEEATGLLEHGWGVR